MPDLIRRIMLLKAGSGSGGETDIEMETGAESEGADSHSASEDTLYEVFQYHSPHLGKRYGYNDFEKQVESLGADLDANAYSPVTGKREVNEHGTYVRDGGEIYLEYSGQSHLLFLLTWKFRVIVMLVNLLLALSCVWCCVKGKCCGSKAKAKSRGADGVRENEDEEVDGYGDYAETNTDGAAKKFQEVLAGYGEVQREHRSEGGGDVLIDGGGDGGGDSAAEQDIDESDDDEISQDMDMNGETACLISKTKSENKETKRETNGANAEVEDLALNFTLTGKGRVSVIDDDASDDESECEA